jgi:hypothetical protein
MCTIDTKTRTLNTVNSEKRMIICDWVLCFRSELKRNTQVPCLSVPRDTECSSLLDIYMFSELRGPWSSWVIVSYWRVMLECTSSDSPFTGVPKTIPPDGIALNLRRRGTNNNTQKIASLLPSAELLS